MIRLPDQEVLEGLCPLGVAVPGPDLLHGVVAAVTGDPAASLGSVQAAPHPYPYTSIATGGLFTVAGTAGTSAGEVGWSTFVKVLQHPRHWPLLHVIPAESVEELLAAFPWRDELDIREQVIDVLPAGLRVPEVFAVADLGEDRLAVWMEDIDDSDAPWSHATHARAAELLARLAARRTPDNAAGACALSPGFAIRKLVETRGGLLAKTVADDALWTRPLVAEVVDDRYRADLRRLAERTPAVLEEMDTLPTALPHGDAAPVNLLRPVDEPDTFVAIDWGFGCQLPLGFDLGQLLCGEAVRGRMDPAELPALLEALLAAYLHGLHEEGLHTTRDEVFRGLVTALATRNGPDAYPFESTDGPARDEHERFLGRRAALGRFVLDLVLGSA